MNLNSALTTITGAALIGLLIVNAPGVRTVFDAVGGQIVAYVGAIQGRGISGAGPIGSGAVGGLP